MVKLSSFLTGLSALAGVCMAVVVEPTLAPRSTTRPVATSVTTDPSSSSSETAAAATHTIAVGANGFKFAPNQVNASVGDTIKFRFYPTGHWVVRAGFGLDNACVPYELSGINLVGFSSGPVDVATTTSDGPTFSVRVNDTEPIFFYCAAAGACVDDHMIGVINPTANETYDKQLAFAEDAAFQLQPGQAWPTESAASSAPSSSSSGTATTTAVSSPSHHSTGLTPGAIAGIAIGAAAVCLLAAALIYLFGRRGGMERAKAFRHQPQYSEAYQGDPLQQFPEDANNNNSSSGNSTAKFAAETTTTPMTAASPFPQPYVGGSMMLSGQGYHPHPQHPMYPGTSASPPPQSEYSHSSTLGSYGPLLSYGSPTLMDQAGGGGTMQSGVFGNMQQRAMSYQHPYNSPVELPTSANPSDSPLPSYSAPERQFSWSQDEEGKYRPSKPPNFI